MPLKNTLIGNLESPRGRGAWEFTVKGNMMWGTLSRATGEKDCPANPRSAKNQSTATTTAMTNHATGTFEVKLTPQDDQPTDPSMGRMTFDKQWSGDITGATPLLIERHTPIEGSVGWSTCGVSLTSNVPVVMSCRRSHSGRGLILRDADLPHILFSGWPAERAT